MTEDNNSFSLDERVVTLLDMKYSICTLLPSSLLQLPCLSDQRNAYRLHTSHNTHFHPEQRSIMFHCDVYLHLHTYLVDILNEKVLKYRDV